MCINLSAIVLSLETPQLQNLPSLSKSTAYMPSSVPTTSLSLSMGHAAMAFLITVTWLSITSLHLYTVLGIYMGHCSHKMYCFYYIFSNSIMGLILKCENLNNFFECDLKLSISAREKDPYSQQFKV